jgi:hypothetical protein
MTTYDKTDSGTTPAGASGNASVKTEITASAKANARNRQQQQKNQKANPPSAKKKQTPVQAASVNVSSYLSSLDCSLLSY